MICRPRFRFGLATLLLGIIPLCVAFAIPKWYEFQRSQARQYIEGLGGRVAFEREFVGGRKRETLLSAFFDRRTDDEANIIGVDLHNVKQLPAIDELADELRNFPNLMTITFPNLLDPDDYIRGVLRRVGGVGYFVEGPVRNNRSDPNTSPDLIRGID